MADSTVLIKNLLLFDLFPGVPKPGFIPGRDIDGDLFGSDYQNTLKAVNAQTGQKACILDPVYGWATFIYLQAGTLDTAPAVAAGSVLGLEIVGDNLLPNGKVTNEDTAGASALQCFLGGPVCLALGTMTAQYFGWFQCGGRPAITLVPDFTTAITSLTDNTVATAKGIELATMADTDNVGFAISDGTAAICGMAFADDA